MSAGPSATPNIFKQNLASGKKQVGLWLALDSANATEIVAGSGFDWLLLDLEHTAIDIGQVVNHLRAAKGGTAELLVRVPWNEPIIFKRLLDVGVRSFIVPMVQSADEARAALAATRYPPHGTRGVAGNTRATNFNRIPNYFQHAHEEHCLVVQIESARGVEAIEEIGAIDGIDGLFIGPNDLAASIGLIGQTTDAQVKELIARAHEKMKRTGKGMGILNFVPSEARALFQAGFNFIAVSSDATILARRSEALLQEIRSGL
jgi:4-hydroxy-2-oxoheptanedioate aldolase